MSKLQSDDLFLLIKKLSKPEKRQFKIYASRHVIGKKNNYVKLFDAIDAQKTYDEEQLLKTEAYITQLSMMKMRLYNSILKSLESCTNTIQFDIRSMLNQADFLFQKGLYDQYDKLLDKAQKIAVKYLQDSYTAEIARLQMNRIIKSGVNINKVKSCWKKKEDAVNNLMNYDIYLMKFAELTIHREQALHLNERELKELNLFMKNPLLQDESKATNPISKIIYYSIHENHLIATKEYEKSFYYSSKKHQLFHSFPQLIKGFFNMYLSSICNCLILCALLKEYQKGELFLNDLKSINDSYKLDKRSEMLVFQSIYEFEIDRCLYKGAFEEGSQMETAIENGIKIYGLSSMGHYVDMYMNTAMLFFGNNDFKKSLKWINKALEIGEDKVEKDLYVAARIVSLIVHYELKNFESLSYFIKSLYRHLGSTENLGEYEKILLHFMSKKLLNESTVESFKTLKESLLKIPNDSQAFNRFNLYLDYISWIDSKIENKPFAEIVKEKAEKK